MFASLLSTWLIGQPQRAQLLDPATDGGFENATATFPANNWTVVNGLSNMLYVGATPVQSDGMYCAFSGSSSTTWAGTAVSSVNHFYRDITFGTETSLDISFKYKLSTTDVGYDNLKVYLVSTGTTPVAGTQISSGQVGAIYESALAWTTVTISGINASSLGTSARLVFSWKMDGVAPNTAVAVDYITVSSSTPPPPLTGIKTIDPAGSGANNFLTFASAISTLNAAGVGAGGVTFNVADGAIFNETGLTISATGTLANPVVFQQSGLGTKPVINFTGTSATADFGFKLAGSDYITFNGLDIRDAGTTSSNYLEYGIYLLGAASDGCQNNTFKNCVVDLTKANTSSRGIYLSSVASVASGANSNNKFYNLTVQDAYNGYYFMGGSTAFDDGNEINTQSGGTSLIDNLGNNLSSSLYGIYIGYQTNLTIANTTISNLTGSSSIYGIYESLGATNTINYLSNDIKTITGTSTSSTIYGMYITTGLTHNIYSNLVHGISAPYSVYGISLSAGTTNNIYKNSIYDINYSGVSSYIAYGLAVTSGTTNNVYNNFIYDIRAAAGTTGAPSVRALSLSGGTTDNVFDNSVLINYTSSNASNQSAALYVTTGPGSVDLRNNIFVNNVNVTTGTRAVAFYKSSSSLTNIAAGSNNNLYYAGVASAKNLIWYDAINSLQTLAAYKALSGLSPRDNNAVSENPPFLSTAGIYNLHLNTSPATLCESGAVRITSPVAVANDIDGNVRWGEAGYAGSGSAPDIGADEGNFSPVLFLPPTNFVAMAFSSVQNNLTFTPTGTPINNVVIVWNLTGTFTAPTGTPPAVGGSLAGGTVLYNGTVSPVQHTGLTFGTIYYYIAYSYDGLGNYTSGVTASAVYSVAPPTALTATAISVSQINLAYTLNALSNNVVIATAATSTFGTPVNGTVLNVNDPITGGGTVIYNGPLAAFSHTGLTASTAYYYKVWSNDALNYYSATGATANATTPCGIVSAFPYTESFSAALGCWSYAEGTVGASFHWGTVAADASHGVSAAQSGTYFASLNVYNASATYNPFYLVSPTFTLDAAAKQVRYYYWLGSSGNTLSPVPLTLQVSSDGGTTWTDLYQHTSANSVFTATSSVTGWTQNTVNLSSYANLTVKFRFASMSNYGSNFCNQEIDEFVVENVPPCQAPTLLTATSMTQNSAILGWSGTSTNYDIEIGPAGFTPTGTPTYSGVAVPYTVSGLNSSTNYGYYVRGNCPGSLQSSWAGPKTFATLCGVSTVPFTENFDSYTVPAVGCGTVIDVNADAKLWATSTGTTYNGANKLSIGYSAVGVTMDDWYISPGLALTGGISYDANFFYRAIAATYPERMEVKFGTTPTAAGMTSAAIFSSVDFINVVYTQGTASFTPSVTGTYYVGWHCNSLGDEDGIYLDQITVDVTPPCPAPSALTATATASQAILGWTQGGSVTSWNIEWGLSGFTQGTGTTINGVTNPYTLTGLSSSSTYAYYVQAACGSSWTGPFAFSTSCAVLSLPYAQNFDGVAAPAIPVCMTVADINADATKWVTSVDAPHSLPNSMYISYNTYSAMNDWFFTPALNMPVGKYLVSFAYKTSGSYPEKLEVKWGSAPTAAGMTNGPIFSNSNITTSAYVSASVYMTVTTAGDYYVGWHGYSDADMYYIAVDDISIIAQPAVDLAFTGFSQTASSLSKNSEGNENGFNVNESKTKGHLNSTLESEGAFVQASDANNTVLLPNPAVVGESKYPITPVGIEALLTNNGFNASTYSLNWIVDGVSQPLYNGPSVAANGGTNIASLTYTPSARGTFITSGSVTAAGDAIAANNSNSFRTRVYPDVFTRTTYDNGTNTPETFVGWNSATIAMKAGVRFTATSDTKLAGVDFVYSTEAITSGTILVQVRAAGTTTLAPGALLYSKSYSTAAYMPNGSSGEYITFAFGNDAPVIASGSDYWITIKTPLGVLYPGAAQSTGITTGRSFYESNTDTTAWNALVLTSVEYAWMMRAINVAPPATTKTLNLTSVLLEGLYNGAGTMRQANDETGTPHFTAPTADQITVELHNSANYSIIENTAAVNLSTSGTATVTIPAALGGSYFITIQHRNSVETTTAAAVSFAGSTITQSFGAPANVYGGNLGLTIDSYYVIYAGDVYRDGAIDSGDFTDVDNDAFNYGAGYLVTDINGDGAIDSGDFTAIDNNGFNYVGTAHP